MCELLCVISEPSIPDIDEPGEDGEPVAPSLNAEVEGDVTGSQAGSTADSGQGVYKLYNYC